MTSRRIVLALAAVVLVAAGGIVAYLAYNQLGGKDPGVTACERAADRAATNETADGGTAEIQMLKDSEHADLRAVGEELDEIARSGDLGQAMGAGARMIAACGAHDVVISPAR